MAATSSLRRIRKSPDAGTNLPTVWRYRMKRGSALRRVPAAQPMRLAEQNGLEGDVCVFELAADAAPITIEAVTGRALMIAPGDRFLGTAGYRESTRWVVGIIPEGGLVPGSDYWVLADCGVVGEFRRRFAAGEGASRAGPISRDHASSERHTLNIRQFALRSGVEATVDHGAPAFLVVGTSSEVGKTTAAINVLRALRRSGGRASWR